MHWLIHSEDSDGIPLGPVLYQSFSGMLVEVGKRVAVVVTVVVEIWAGWVTVETTTGVVDGRGFAIDLCEFRYSVY